jgi:hypothetical protein
MAPATMEQLAAEARYARERYELYKARAYGGRPVSQSKLRELERAHDGAQARLRRAQIADRDASRDRLGRS